MERKKEKEKKKNTAVIVESGAELIEPQNLESAIKGFQMTQCWVFFFFPLALPRVKLTCGDSVIQLPEKFTSIFFFFFLMNWTHNKEAVAVGVLEPLWLTIVDRRWLHRVPRREASASPKLIYHGSKRSRGSLAVHF